MLDTPTNTQQLATTICTDRPDTSRQIAQCSIRTRTAITRTGHLPTCAVTTLLSTTLTYYTQHALCPVTCHHFHIHARSNANSSRCPYTSTPSRPMRHDTCIYA